MSCNQLSSLLSSASVFPALDCDHAYSYLEVFGVSTSRLLEIPALCLTLALLLSQFSLDITALCFRAGCFFLSSILAWHSALFLKVVNVENLISCLSDFHSAAQHPVIALSCMNISLVILNVKQISLVTN